MSQTIRNFDLLSMVPPSIRYDEQVIAACSALETELQEITTLADSIEIINNLSTLDADILDHLAWAWHVDFYEDTLDLDTKRSLVKNAIQWHRKKGTTAVVQEYVSTILENAEVQEWFDYSGDPYHFRVVKIGGEMLEADQYTRLKSVIDTVKNARSYLDGVSLSRTLTGTMYLGGAISIHKRMEVG